jgi:hypothetical protein
MWSAHRECKQLLKWGGDNTILNIAYFFFLRSGGGRGEGGGGKIRRKA